jgi:hypothetical protein
VSRPTPDDYRLARRLILAVGIHPDASMMQRRDVLAMLFRAREMGRCLGVAEVAGFQHCRVCGCTALVTCRPEPCTWVEADLCSACAEFPDTAQ